MMRPIKIFVPGMIAAAATSLALSAFVTTTRAQTGETGIVKLANSNIQYFSRGEGETIVLLPGGTLTVGYLDGLAEALAKAGYRVVGINFRGSGKSTGPSAGVTLQTMADDVAGVIQALKLAPVNVAGNDFGNRVARMLAASHPELAAMPYLVANPADSARVWALFKPYRDPGAAAIEKAAADATPLEAWWAPPGQTKYLILQGADDQIAPPENGVELQKELGERATLVNVPGAAHLLPLEQPETAASQMIGFIRQLGGKL